MTNITIRLAEENDSPGIATMLRALTDEIIAETGAQHFHVDLAAAAEQCGAFIRAGHYTVLLALSPEGLPVGFISLCPSYALYAEGAFAVVQECFVVPEYRCRSVGGQLLQAVYRLARSRNWRRLELCTPPLPQFERSIKFYERNGFQVTGGRKMKWMP